PPPPARDVAMEAVPLPPDEPRPPETCHRPAQQESEPTDAAAGHARRVARSGVLAHRAHGQSEARVLQCDRNYDDDRDREVEEPVLLEQHLAEPRNRGENRYVQRAER